MLTLLVPGIGGWRVAWVNSLCIGMTANLLIFGAGRLLWGEREPPAIGLIALCLASVFAAIWIGAHLAAYWLDQPADWLNDDAGGVRVAALLATLGGTAAVCGVIWVRQYAASLRLRALLEQARAEAATRLADEARLRMLRAQLEPHMLFNTLATLRALIGIAPEQAQTMLDHLVIFMRTTLGAARSDRIDLATEFSLLDSYLNLMAIRMGERLSYALDLPADLARCPVPPLLLQPLVENAIRHGLEPLARGGRIEAAAWRDGTDLCLRVSDTGDGFCGLPAEAATEPAAPAANAAAAGFGLDSVRARLRVAYGGAAQIAIDSPWPPDGPGGTRITLRLPASEPVPHPAP